MALWSQKIFFFEIPKRRNDWDDNTAIQKASSIIITWIRKANGVYSVLVYPSRCNNFSFDFNRYLISIILFDFNRSSRCQTLFRIRIVDYVTRWLLKSSIQMSAFNRESLYSKLNRFEFKAESGKKLDWDLRKGSGTEYKSVCLLTNLGLLRTENGVSLSDVAKHLSKFTRPKNEWNKHHRCQENVTIRPKPVAAGFRVDHPWAK